MKSHVMEESKEEKKEDPAENPYQLGIHYLREYKKTYKSELLQQALPILFSSTHSCKYLSDEELSDIGISITVRSHSEGRIALTKQYEAWLLKAAEEGYANAQYTAGHSYRYGLLKDILIYDEYIAKGYSDREARYWTKKAGRSEHPLCQERMIAWYLKAAEKKHREAFYELAQIYSWGAEGLKEDLARSNELYRKAGELGHIEAQLCLAKNYKESKGIKENKIAAANWFRRAAEQKNIEGMIELMDRYQTGTGVLANPFLAAQWLHKSFLFGTAYSCEGIESFCDFFKKTFSADFSKPLSLRQIGFIFQSHVIQDFLIAKNEAYEDAEKARHAPGMFVCGVAYTNPAKLMSDEVKNKMIAGFRFIAHQYPEVVCCLLKQESGEKQTALINYLSSEQKEIIAKQLTDSAGQHEALILNQCVTLLEEKLFSLQENPKSAEAKCSGKLLKNLSPFQQLLNKPLTSREKYQFALTQLAKQLQSDCAILSSSTNTTLYAKDISVVIRVLEEAFDIVKAFAPVSESKEVLANNSRCIIS